MYSGNRLAELLEKQHEKRLEKSEKYKGLFKKATFTIQWRAKVGSFPHPDLETIVSAGEPCGAWKLNNGRPEDKRNVCDNLNLLSVLPLNGYIPGSSIRGLVRTWAKQIPEIKPRMLEILGFQDNENITPGKIEFLDAWPEKATKLTLDIVNPQEHFQVYHQGQSTPLSFYTLGNGEKPINVTVAIRGIPGKVTETEVEEVWGWVQQALSLYGVGSRTASGYGAIKTANLPKLTIDPSYAVKQFDFSLFSQGCYGADPHSPDLRPAHWRGWLRSWVLRFLLGVMSPENAQKTLGELFGTLDAGDGKGRKGCVRLEMIQGENWGEVSGNQPRFYTWKGQLKISATKNILNQIVLPIVKFAVMVGGVGRGWRRPLHIFVMNNGRSAARGTYLSLTHKIRKPDSNEYQVKLYGIACNPSDWQKLYQDWQTAVQLQWSDRYALGNNPTAEVFSPTTCAIYLVPEPCQEPLDRQDFEWSITNPTDTRGCGMNLIYDLKYKRKIDVGGNAAGGGNAHCSWVSIKRVNIPNKEQNTNCQEVVCLFMGGQTPNSSHLRSQFLNDLSKIPGAVHLFGVQAPEQQ
ncbi:RAMP superfamily CRISPR-associated protein [Argonema antarcticum]|uniref:RAMP superfamily CRISPR-associated protein n=1 Tax=Argonema antarcticum TaxID=2942763 RepID=UPI002011DD5A|nr:RAMP superfamily CRISPR-associated protein [Argonema antarcticum]MCL1472484.1 RAMP superfamily CRISPR-associated protein [Argonema antarcticum A004/B2]